MTVSGKRGLAFVRRNGAVLQSSQTTGRGSCAAPSFLTGGIAVPHPMRKPIVRELDAVRGRALVARFLRDGIQIERKGERWTTTACFVPWQAIYNVGARLRAISAAIAECISIGPSWMDEMLEETLRETPPTRRVRRALRA
jgi:hypothetical protein